jgi:hypothetical protein
MGRDNWLTVETRHAKAPGIFKLSIVSSAAVTDCLDKKFHSTLHIQIDLVFIDRDVRVDLDILSLPTLE